MAVQKSKALQIVRIAIGLSLVGIAAATVACSGSIQSSAEPPSNAGGSAGNKAAGGSGGATASAACGEKRNPGPTPLRRLTRWEYNNTVAQLLGDKTHPAFQFVPEASQLGFDNNADSTTLSSVLISQQEEAAGKLAQTAAANLPGLLKCDVATKGEDVCAAQFISTFGRLAMRRKLTVREVDRYTAFYTQQKQAGTFASAIEQIVKTMLLSPAFLYRPELGTTDPNAKGALRLSGYEVANRLSYLFWGSMPDDLLFDAADADMLGTPDQIRLQAERMLADSKGQRAIKNFYSQWASLAQLASTPRDATFTPAIAELQRQETEAFVDEVIRRGDGKWSTLLTAPFSFMDASLVSFYGVSNATAGKDLQKVSLDPKRHSGLLTQGSLMTLLAHPGQTAPVLRGKFVMERILCQALPPPPNNVDTTVPAPDPKVSPRKQLEQKTQTVQPCLNCHNILNPPGFAFDHFDSTGKWRATDHDNIPIDTSGVLQGTDVDGPFTDHVELAKRLAQSKLSRDCVVTEWFRYAYGRDHTDADECTINQLQTLFDASGGDLRKLLLGLAQTDAFRYRLAPTGGGN